MSHFSKIRRVALNLIYAAVENDCAPGELNQRLFWDLTLEKETDHYRTALSKALLHAARPTEESLRLLTERTSALCETMHGDLTTLPLREAAERYAEKSASLSSFLSGLRYCLKDKRRDGSEQLQLCCNDILKASATLVELTDKAEAMAADFPAYREVTEPYVAVLRRRRRALADCAALATPEELTDVEYGNICRMAKELTALPAAAGELAQKVLEQRKQADARITELLNNYSTERLDIVDKCILYLALYELETNRLEPAIVVSEATALADTYAGSKSARFIHGIIGAAAKNL